MASKTKTETIKARSIYVYLPSEKMVDDWKENAKSSGLSISKFVQEHVEKSLNHGNEDTFVSRGELLKRNMELEETVRRLEKENNRLSLLVDRFDNELKHYRAKPFLESPDLDKKEYDTRLIELLKEKGTLKENDIFVSLGLDPKDTDLLVSIHKQLEELERFGLVTTLPNGWRWLG